MATQGSTILPPRRYESSDTVPIPHAEIAARLADVRASMPEPEIATPSQMNDEDELPTSPACPDARRRSSKPPAVPG